MTVSECLDAGSAVRVQPLYTLGHCYDANSARLTLFLSFFSTRFRVEGLPAPKSSGV